jgi:hypothetical protein
VLYRFEDGTSIRQQFAEKAKVRYVMADVVTAVVTIETLTTTGPAARDFTAISRDRGLRLRHALKELRMGRGVGNDTAMPGPPIRSVGRGHQTDAVLACQLTTGWPASTAYI